MSVKGKKHLSMMFALCKTIAESAEHLNEYSEDHFLKQDTVTGLNTLEASLESFKAYSAIQATRLFRSCVENDLYLYSGDFASIVSHWHTSVLRTIQMLWTAESQRCPVCDKPGNPFYTAYFYRNTGGSDGSASVSRLWMQCPGCLNCYAVKNSPYPFPVPADADTGSNRYIRIAEVVKEHMKGGFLLFAGENNNAFTSALDDNNYIIQRCSLKQLEDRSFSEELKGCFQAVLIEHPGRSADLKKLLENALYYLDDSGILWFEVRNLGVDLLKLVMKGTPLPESAGTNVFLFPQGIEYLKDILGFDIISRRRIEEEGKIEFVLQKL